jgi:transposase
MPLHAAGIAVGATAPWVAVPEDRDEEPVRRFGALTAALSVLAAWRRPCQSATVVMESTGVSGMPLCEGLEARGCAVKLVDAHDARQVPGRKTDVTDCQGLQELHPSG